MAPSEQTSLQYQPTKRPPQAVVSGTTWGTANARPPLCVVVLVLMLGIATATAAFLISLVVDTAADEFSSAAITFAEETAENTAAKIAAVIKVPQQIVVQNALALESRTADGRRILDPTSIEDGAVWVGPHMSSRLPLYFAFHDNISGNSTILFNTFISSNGTGGPAEHFMASHFDPPGARAEDNAFATIRSPSNPTVVLSSFPYTQEYNFRKLPMFDELMRTTDGSIRWYPPTASYYDNDVRMVIAQPYKDLHTGEVRGIHLGMIFVTAVSDVLRVLQYGQSDLLSGTVALVDVASGAFMGGNFVDNGLRYNDTTSTAVQPNGTSTTTTSRTTRLASLCEAHDDQVRLACRKLGEGVLMGCRAPMSLFFRDDHPHWLLRGIESRTIVHVTSITDRYGLNLRLMVILRLGTTLGALKRGLEIALLAIVISITTLLVGAGLVAYRSLLPLRVLEAQLLLAAKMHRARGRSSDRGSDDEGAQLLPPAVSASVYAEVEAVLGAFTLLKADLDTMVAFFPPGFLMVDSSATAEGLGASSERSRDMSTSSSPFAGYSILVAGNLLQPHASGSSGGTEMQKRLVNSDAHLMPVTVLVMNLCGSHALSVKSLDAFSQHHRSMLTAIQKAASLSRGVVHAFYGDQFTITFNASATRCRSHVLQCASFIDLLHSEIGGQHLDDAAGDRQEDYTPLVYAGAATGPALVRQMGGTRAMQRLNVVGPVVTQASCLMRLAKARRASTLVSDAFVAGLRGVQLAAVEDAIAGDNALTMLPRLAVHHVALVKVPFRDTPMVASSLWKVRASAAVDDEPPQAAQTLAERMAEASSAPNGLVPLDGGAVCDALLCTHGPSLSAHASRGCTTVAGLRAANSAMLAYECGDRGMQALVADCAARHPLSLVRFFFVAGIVNAAEHART